ncbi:MAG TPA: tetratricopeptide repeat protein [Gemmatimonadaceae bacterium]|nr:tetratricopeptide repeat protein [Gemmatimonadaceae bacterium]
MAQSLLLQARVAARAGKWPEVLNMLGTATEPLPDPDRATLVAEALLRTARPRDADEWLRRLLPHIEHDDPYEWRRGINMRGVALFEMGELDQAETVFQQVLQVGHAVNDPLLVARATNNLGQIKNVRGQRDDALALYQLAVPAYQQLGHVLGLAETYHNMAISHLCLDRLTQADECELRAIEFAREVAAVRLAALARIGRADVALRRGDAEIAYVTALRVAIECHALADPAGAADGLRVVGLACIARGELDDAAVSLTHAWQLAERCASPRLSADALRAYAQLAVARGSIGGARRHANTALDLYKRAGAIADYEALSEWRAQLSQRAS